MVSPLRFFNVSSRFVELMIGLLQQIGWREYAQLKLEELTIVNDNICFSKITWLLVDEDKEK